MTGGQFFIARRTTPKGWWRTAPCAWAYWLDVTRRGDPFCSVNWTYCRNHWEIFTWKPQAAETWILLLRGPGQWWVLEIILSEMLNWNLHFRHFRPGLVKWTGLSLHPTCSAHFWCVEHMTQHCLWPRSIPYLTGGWTADSFQWVYSLKNCMKPLFFTIHWTSQFFMGTLW